ncbi:hypothetical protein LTR36_006362 [Oleoguttula mirabilis]|uniref:SP-RING-type domain-containing protein n=1 Tax=Oleoguttula mirabilis TaxID=1507867 RepID=A0AAV9JWB8_9PEZI|nr:hypothetical protein LTR36_006362 [Oleoguttula mirabilis]
MATRYRQSTELPTPRARQSLETPASRFRQATATPARQSTSTPGPSRATEQQLPPYEQPVFSLNPGAQRALAALQQASSLKKLDKHLGEAQGAVSNAAAEINDRLTFSDGEVAKFKKRRRNDDEEGADEAQSSQDAQIERDLEKLREKVDRMTQRMDESMRKLIDGQHGVEAIKESVAATEADARANASTQASTQQLRSQRRPRRGSGSGSDEEEEEEYPEFAPTDPTGATQPQQSTIDVFRTKLDNLKTRYQSHSLAARYTENNDYVQFRRVVHHARNPDDDVPMPHASSWFPEGDVPAPGITARPRANAEEDDDDDIAIERATISTKCPLTLQEFRNPLSSTKCNHSFEADAIMEMMRNSPQRNAVQCPVPGCKEMLAKSDLHSDAVLLRKIKRLQRAKEMEEEEADYEDGSDGRTQRNATFIDDEDGADVDALVEKQTQMKAEPRATARSAAAASTAPHGTAPIELGGSSDEEGDEDTGME